MYCLLILSLSFTNMSLTAKKDNFFFFNFNRLLRKSSQNIPEKYGEDHGKKGL